MDEALALSVQLAREDRVVAARKVLSQRRMPEGADVALIRFHLPHGGKISERFHRDDDIEVRLSHDNMEVCVGVGIHGWVDDWVG